jgi:hypothetical protein
MVRLRGVPFFRATSGIGRVRWDKVRFDLPMFEAWEQAHQERFRGGPVAAPTPVVSRQRSRANAESPTEDPFDNWREASSRRKRRIRDQGGG